RHRDRPAGQLPRRDARPRRHKDLRREHGVRAPTQQGGCGTMSTREPDDDWRWEDPFARHLEAPDSVELGSATFDELIEGWRREGRVPEWPDPTDGSDPEGRGPARPDPDRSDPDLPEPDLAGPTSDRTQATADPLARTSVDSNTRITDSLDGSA